MSKRGLIIVLILLLFLCLIDGGLTLLWLKYSLATEWNLLMASLISKSTVLFIAAKMTITSLSGYLLYRLRKYKLARCALVTSVVIYIGVIAYHLASVI